MELKKENLRNIAGGTVIFNKTTKLPFKAINRIEILRDAKRADNGIIVTSFGLRDANDREILSLGEEEIARINGGRADCTSTSTEGILIPLLITTTSGEQSVIRMNLPFVRELVERRPLENVLGTKVVNELRERVRSFAADRIKDYGTTR